MRLFRTAVVCVSIGTSWAWGVDTRTDLDQARASYQKSVTQYGKNSPQAKTARNNLRSARRTYHSTLRQRQLKHARAR